MVKSNDKGFLERFFKLSENNTDVKTELMAGLTTFMTMSYILAVNPGMLGEAGMDAGGVFTATAVAAIIGTLCMALYANLPFALAPGMGLNAFFTYSVVMGMGHTWQFALTAVFLEGVIFMVLSFFKVREAIFNAIPRSLKNAVSVGIGLFIALIGFSNAGLIVNDGGTILSLGNLLTWEAAVTIFGILFTGFLLAKQVKGALLFGILASTVLALITGVTSLPTGSPVTLPPSLGKVAFQLEWSNIFTRDMLMVVFTFLFVDIFDTVGTLAGVASKAGMLDEEGNLPRVERALMSDAIATTAGSLLGTSTVTTFVESAAGVAEGGRTGLTGVSTAFFFALSLFLFPIFGIIPPQATAPALILVGLFMMAPIKEIDLDDYTEAVPAFLTIVMMPFAYSIAEGISAGMITYVILKVITGKSKDVSWLMYILAAVFLLRIFAPMLGQLF